ncbi:MAG TPA: hypothetical protein VGJ04_12210 [Pirellulales bacterium]|jgi:hypothetical protein
MFTFCFTTVAAAQLRQIRVKSNSARKPVLGAVRLGLATLAVLAFAAGAQAKGPSGHSGSSSSSMGSMFSQANKFKLNQSSDKKLDSKPFKIDSLHNVVDKTTTTKGIDPLKVTGSKTDKLKDMKSFKLQDFKQNKLKDLSGDKKDMGKFCDSNKCHLHCSPWWYCWNYPCWNNLYGCGCGDWYDVPVVIIRQGVDLQLLAVRTIDSGDPENQLGPAVRVWLRNNSPVAINRPFNVLALAARDAQPTADLPQAGVRIDAIEAGQTLAVDIRLPVEANLPGFPMFHVLVDSHREISEVNEGNNGLVIARAEVKPVEITQPAGIDAAPAGDQTVQPTTIDTPATTDTAANVPLMMQGVKAE